MTTINLREFYSWYKQDEFVELPDEVAAELIEGRKYEKHHEQRMRRNKSVYSLDAGDDIETAAIIHTTDNPEAIFELMERHCRICCALNSLPEIQGRRIEAHYILGKSIKEIAAVEGTGERNIRKSIYRGLASMKIHLKNFDVRGPYCPKSEGGI